MMIVGIATQSDAATITPPAGWTAFADSPVTDAPTGDSRLYCWWRVSDGSEPVSNIFTLSTPTACAGGAVIYSGAGAIDQQEMAGDSTAGTVATTPAITASEADTMVVCAFAADATGADEWTELDPLTKRVDIGDTSAFVRFAFADAPASEMGYLYPDTILETTTTLYPDSDHLFGQATLVSSLPMMTGVFNIKAAAVTASGSRRRMLMGVGS